MSGLLIQHAKWQGEFVTPDDKRLESGKKCDCVCIGCGESLILKRGDKKQWHFAHCAKTSCGGETYIHKVVKTWIAEKLIGQILSLPVHPELDSPKEFLVESGEIEKYNSTTKRQYDVVLKGIFSYGDTDQVNHGELIFEVHYSNPKDDCFKLQVQEWKIYVLEVDAKTFYGDGREKFTIETLSENSEWTWLTDNQKLWAEYGLKNSVRDIVANWITEETWIDEEVEIQHGRSKFIRTGYGHFDVVKPQVEKKIIRKGPFYRHFGVVDRFDNDGPLRDYGLYTWDFWDRRNTTPYYFHADKCWKNRKSDVTGKIYDIVFQGDFVGRSVNARKKSCLVFQLVDSLGEYDDDFKQEIRKAKFCVLEVDIHGFFADGLEPPTHERFKENTQWVW